MQADDRLQHPESGLVSLAEDDINALPVEPAAFSPVVKKYCALDELGSAVRPSRADRAHSDMADDAAVSRTAARRSCSGLGPTMFGAQRAALNDVDRRIARKTAIVVPPTGESHEVMDRIGARRGERHPDLTFGGVEHGHVDLVVSMHIG